MSETRSAAGGVLHSQFEPFHRAQGKQLTAVLGRDTGEGEEIILAFSGHGLVFRCDEDSDTVHVAFETIEVLPDTDDLTADPAWSRFIGKEFFWGWLMLNQQGYRDGVLLSFDGVVPEIGLNVVTSAFEVLEIRQRAR